MVCSQQKHIVPSLQDVLVRAKEKQMQREKKSRSGFYTKVSLTKGWPPSHGHWTALDKSKVRKDERVRVANPTQGRSRKLCGKNQKSTPGNALPNVQLVRPHDPQTPACHHSLLLLLLPNLLELHAKQRRLYQSSS